MKINSEFKTILILWIIAIIISWIGLYQFRDIKFKNTKQLTKQNEERIQNLENEYNELIDVYIPTITDIPEENNLPTTWSIKIIIPWFFKNQWFDTISNNLKQNDINISFQTIDSYSKYETEIKNNLQNYDIALIPLNRIIWLETETINLWENIKPYFIGLFELDSFSNSSIPFAIDPAITLYKSTTSEQNSRENLFSYSLSRKSQKKYSMPILWWFDELTLDLIKSNKIPFENYIELLYLQIKQIKYKGDNSELSNMLNTNNITLKEKYTYKNFNTILTTLKNQNENCSISPALCIIKYWFADIKFWFLSDMDILEKYFPWSHNLYAWNFTNSENNYPVKWRVFIVPKWNQNTNLTNKFFSEYISQSIDWNDTFRGNTLSAITNIYDTQKTKDIFKNIIWNENNFYIFTGSINLQDQIINDWRTLEMLKWNYNVKSYLSNFPY